MNRVTIAIAAIAVVLLAQAPLSWAQDRDLLPRTQNGISYLSGGVGSDQQDAMAGLAQQGYNLKLVFAEQGTGAYLADVRVTVADARGRPLLDAVADGPAFFAKLPQGQYTITADYRGARQTRTVHVGRNAAVALYWPPEGGSAPEPASSRAPHGDGAKLTPGHAGDAAGEGR